MDYPLTALAKKAPAERNKIWDDCLDRLGLLAGTDEGFFTLAVHSLVEAWVNALHPEFEDRNASFTFYDKIERHLESGSQTRDYGPLLQSFLHTYKKTNGVRHHFASVDRSVVGTVTGNLCGFSLKAGLGSAPALSRLKTLASRWQTPEDHQRVRQELDKVNRMLSSLNLSPDTLQARLMEVSELQEQARKYQADLVLWDRRIREAEASKDHQEEKIQQLRVEKNHLQRQNGEILSKLEATGEAAACLEQLLDAHGISRSRLEYEQTLIRLSEEQEQVLRYFRPGESFLITGGAGTGKTLVLLAAVKKLRSTEASQLGFVKPAKVVLLSFTRTLKNYSEYLCGLLDPEAPLLEVSTVDGFFLPLFRQAAGEKSQIRWDLKPEDLGLKVPEEVWDELENFVWARGLSRKEYVEDRIPRVGRKIPLGTEKRGAAWDEGEGLLAAMGSRSIYSRNGSRTLILRNLEKSSGSRDVEDWDVIAVDEVQDLAPVEIKILGKLSGALLMAGDAGQSLYRTGFRFQDAGVDITGRSRALKLSFRSTRPLEKLARTFLTKVAEKAGFLAISTTEAMRDGLPPRLIKYTRNVGWKGVLLDSLEFYRKILGYQPSSLAVLTPDNESADKVADLLSHQGIPLVLLKDREDWMSQEGVRISTIHSAKGLDFPCVVTLLPALPRDEGLSEEMRYRSQANLVYVGLTRALENQTVIMPAETSSTVLVALRESFPLK